MSNNDAVFYSHKLDIFLMAVGSAGVFVTIYHCVTACLYSRRREPTPPSVQEPPRSADSSVANLIPAHKYQKRLGLDGTCAICISEFEEGEQVRTLPECMHAYHVPCIDMWFSSHSSCPMCRSDATPARNFGGLEVGAEESRRGGV